MDSTFNPRKNFYAKNGIKAPQINVYIYELGQSLFARDGLFRKKNYAYIAIEVIDFRTIYMYIIDTNVRFDEEKALRVLWNNLS